MVEKDIEVNEREITEMEEEFVNLEKLHSDDIETEEGARYLSLKLQSSVTVHNQEVSSVSTVLWTFVHSHLINSRKNLFIVFSLFFI